VETPFMQGVVGDAAPGAGARVALLNQPESLRSQGKT